MDSQLDDAVKKVGCTVQAGRWHLMARFCGTDSCLQAFTIALAAVARRSCPVGEQLDRLLAHLRKAQADNAAYMA